MHSQISRHSFITALFLSMMATTGFAQDMPAKAIVATGTATVEVKPSLLRMTIELSEKEPTAEEVIQKITDRQEAARLQLEAFGASKGSIKISPLSVPSGASDYEQQMRQMVMYQMRQSGRSPKALKPPKSVTVTSTVTAEWPLDMETQQQAIIFATKLKDKVVEADLAGVNEPKELTPEEEEFQAEMQEAMSQYSYSSDEEQPGQPTFAYVAELSEEQRSAAMADAYKQAETKAQRLADAAGTKLGKLAFLSEGFSAETYDPSVYMQFAMGMRSAMNNVVETEENESASASPGPISFRVRVNAGFNLE